MENLVDYSRASCNSQAWSGQWGSDDAGCFEIDVDECSKVDEYMSSRIEKEQISGQKK